MIGPRPHRRRAKTVTRDTVKWKSRDEVYPMTGLLAEVDIERIAASYAIDPALLRALDLRDFCRERLAHFPGVSPEGDGVLVAER